ncbi:hypothetical protein [Nitrosopumilus sp.]|uniref:hypothetical protein n=1 Tax=Nitrosopumilus sp. TaxID=2024843 RepID=UPI00247B967D|nr:hypothetical protein [Nitrosopumilus sp.]MCV0430655.1 hypothetical protein [Nitrosopumilus sp.]
MDDTDEIKMIELDVEEIRKKMIKALGTDEEIELKRKYDMLQKRKTKLLRRKNRFK